MFYVNYDKLTSALWWSQVNQLSDVTSTCTCARSGSVLACTFYSTVSCEFFFGPALPVLFFALSLACSHSRLPPSAAKQIYVVNISSIFYSLSKWVVFTSSTSYVIITLTPDMMTSKNLLPLLSVLSSVRWQHVDRDISGSRLWDGPRAWEGHYSRCCASEGFPACEHHVALHWKSYSDHQSGETKSLRATESWINQHINMNKYDLHALTGSLFTSENICKPLSPRRTDFRFSFNHSTVGFIQV